MSSCLVLQAKDKLYIGADTSSSVFIGEKLYRLNDNTKKLFLLDNNTVLYCAGNNSIAKKVTQYISSIYLQDDFSLTSLKNWLVEMYPYKNKDKTVYDVEILIATFKNNKTIVYQMSQYKNYDIVSFEVSDAGVQILSAGIKNSECMSYAEKELLNQSGVKSIFCTTFSNLSCNYIGGCLDLYEISKNGVIKIFDNEKINEHGIQYVNDIFNSLSVSLNAEVLVSKLVMSENLWIENDSGNYKFDDSGFIATNGKNTIKIQPNKSEELFSIYKDSRKQVYINSNGDVEFAGSLKSATGTFSGLISGGSININNTFTVDKDGHMIASSGTFGGLVSGGSININDNFVVDSSGRITANVGTFGGLVSGGSININNNFTVDKYGNMIALSGTFGGLVSGGSININDNFTVDKYGNMIAKSGKFSGDITGSTGTFAGNIKAKTINIQSYDETTGHGGFITAWQYGVTVSGGDYNTDIYGKTITIDGDNILLNGAVELKKVPYVSESRSSLATENYAKNCERELNSNNITVEYTPVGNINIDKCVGFISQDGNVKYGNIASVGYVQSKLTSSDKRIKKNIIDMPDIQDIYMDIPTYQFEYDDILEREGICYGTTAQGIEKALEKHGLNAEDYNIVGRRAPNPFNGETKHIPKGDDLHYINWDNVNGMSMYMIQKLVKRVDELEKEIAELKGVVK